MPVRMPELTTRIHHPPQSWLRHGETRQPPQRDDELAIIEGGNPQPVGGWRRQIR